MNMPAVGVEGDIGAAEDIPFSVSIAAEAISMLLVLTTLLISDTVLTSHCSRPCENNLYFFIYFQQIREVQPVNISAIKNKSRTKLSIAMLRP